jgi:23S rRNA (cytidine2498-2'-O)-methyltransferase
MPVLNAMQLPAMNRFVFTCEANWHQPTLEELLCVFPGLQRHPSSSDCIICSLPEEGLRASPCIAFAAQCLPYTDEIRIESISDAARVIGKRIMASLADHDGPWRLHLFGEVIEARPKVRRYDLIRQQVVELLKKNRRKLLRAMNAADGPWQEGEALVQMRFGTDRNGDLSICDSAARFHFRRMLAPFCGGVAVIPNDKRAPSRAFAKLLEAEIRLGGRIEAGQICVDLGSSPGSWAYVALGRGARVVAVDRAPLREDLTTNPSLEFVRGDAFKYHPAEPVDWMLCDVVALPQPIIELLQKWIERRWCRRFCVTIKFRGSAEYTVLEPLKAWLAVRCGEFVMRRLTNNKNEVIVAGELAARS